MSYDVFPSPLEGCFFFIAFRPGSPDRPGRHQAGLITEHPFATGQRWAEPPSRAIVARWAASHLAMGQVTSEPVDAGGEIHEKTMNFQGILYRYGYQDFDSLAISVVDDVWTHLELHWWINWKPGLFF